MFRKKLFIEEHKVTKEESGTQLDLEEECKELKKYFSTLDIIGQRAMKKKVQELTHPSTTSKRSPPVKYKSNKGNNKGKRAKENDVHRDFILGVCLGLTGKLEDKEVMYKTN